VNRESDRGRTSEPSGWLEDVERITRAGDVYVRLHNSTRELTVQLSSAGAHRQKLARTRFGDVSYTKAAGLSDAAAAKTARAYAARLDSAASRLPAHLPHLAVAAAAGRTPGSCRPAVTALWPRDVALPAARDELRLDPSGVGEFLAPELGVDAAPFAGFALRSIQLAPVREGGSECVLELEPESDTSAPEPVLIALGLSWSEGKHFGARQTVPMNAATSCRTSPASARCSSRSSS